MPDQLTLKIALAALVLAATPALAQVGGPSGNNSGGMGNLNMIPEKQVDPAELERREAVDKAYKDTLKKQSLQTPATVDPWSNMRGNDPQPAAAPKSAAKKKPATQN